MRNIVFIFACVALALICIVPRDAAAVGIEYVTITEEYGDSIKVKRSTLASESWYVCSISTRACTDTASTTPLTTEPTSPNPAAVWRGWLPAGASWLTMSPDGKFIAFYIAGTESRGERTFGIFDTATQKTYVKNEKLEYWDLLTEGIRIFAFSPDSKTLLYLNDIKKHPVPYKVSLDSLNPASDTFTSGRLFSRDYVVADMLWLDSDKLLFSANRENPYQWNLYEYTLSTGGLRTIATDVSYATNLKKSGSFILFSEANATGIRPKVYDPASGITHSLALPPIASLETKGKVVTTLKGGVSGVFLLEANKNSDTLLVWLHGGPFRQASATYHPYLSYGGYDWILENARRANVGVLKIDYPGSAGFGRPYAESIMGNVGVKDVADTATAIADFAKRNKYSKVYLMGNSYGGYLALKLLVEKPNAYQGALSINGVADWTTMLTAMDNSIFNKQFGGNPNEDNYEAYAAASIYNHIDKLAKQKVILAHGEKDMTIPFRQSEGLATSLKAVNKNVELLPFAGEDHVFKKTESFETLCRETLEFVGKFDTANCDL